MRSGHNHIHPGKSNGGRYANWRIQTSALLARGSTFRRFHNARLSLRLAVAKPGLALPLTGISVVFREPAKHLSQDGPRRQAAELSCADADRQALESVGYGVTESGLTSATAVLQ